MYTNLPLVAYQCGCHELVVVVFFGSGGLVSSREGEIWEIKDDGLLMLPT